MEKKSQGYTTQGSAPRVSSELSVHWGLLNLRVVVNGIFRGLDMQMNLYRMRQLGSETDAIRMGKPAFGLFIGRIEMQYTLEVPCSSDLCCEVLNAM